jgi:hypothetical protein
LPAWFIRTLPEAVRRNRFLAPLFDFIFGMIAAPTQTNRHSRTHEESLPTPVRGRVIATAPRECKECGGAQGSGIHRHS